MGREERARHRQVHRAATDQTDVPSSGLGGQAQRLLVRPVFKDGDPRNLMRVGGSQGAYRVVFTFARPGYTPVKEREFSFDPALPGDSHLAIAPPAVTPPVGIPGVVNIRIYSTTEDGQFEFLGHPNAAGFLGTLETTIEANDFRDAELKSHRALAPSLSNWSVHLDVPFWIWRTHITELGSSSAQIQVRNPFPNVPLALAGSGELSKEFRAFASLYREAVGTNSRVYEFLCLFKIAEGVRKRRERLVSEAIVRGERPTKPVERIPGDRAMCAVWLNALFPVRAAVAWDDLTLDSVCIPEALGRKINDILDRELADVRNDIAHALSDDSGEPSLVLDEAMHLDRVSRWLPLMKCIVRRMLKNEFPSEFLPYLNEDGTIHD